MNGMESTRTLNQTVLAGWPLFSLEHVSGLNQITSIPGYALDLNGELYRPSPPLRCLAFQLTWHELFPLHDFTKCLRFAVA